MRQQIDFQPASHKLDEVLYNVALQPVYSSFRFPDTLFNQPISTKNYLAVVNQKNGNIISVVGHNYQLIPNSEALDMGKHLFTLLYPGLKKEELIPYKVIAPFSLASAHIDLIHKNVDFRVWEQETWLPFLRVSNSYNRTHALTFEIGFVRKLCSNGMLFRKRSMVIKYPHANNSKIDLESDALKIKDNQNIFSEHCQQLAAVSVPAELMFPLVCRMLNINLGLPEKRQFLKKLKYLDELYRTVNNLTSFYTNEKDPNGYDALSVISDLVSHQDQYKSLMGYYLNTRSWFVKPADFMDELTTKSRNAGFDLGDMLKDTIRQIMKLQDFLGMKWMMN